MSLPTLLADTDEFLEVAARVTFDAMFGPDVTWDTAPDWRRQAWRNVKEGQNAALLATLRSRLQRPPAAPVSTAPPTAGLSTEHAWAMLRDVAGISFGEPGYFSAPHLLNTAREQAVTVRTGVAVHQAAHTLGLVP